MIKINGNIFGADTFPNGEVVYKTVTLNGDVNRIRMNYENGKDVGDLMFAVKYVKEKEPESVIELHIYYMPYSRMDREINNQIFSLRLFAQIIADMKIDRVYVVDPHSNVCEEEFKRAGVNLVILDTKLREFITRAINEFNPDVLFLPDKGAYGKYIEIIKDVAVAVNRPVLYGKKMRNLNEKGKIIGYAIVNDNNVDLKGKKVLIIDDICSFGGTALNAAKKLKENGVKEVGFYIAHAEYCIGGGELLKTDFVDKIYTTTTLLKHTFKNGIMASDMDNEWALNIGVAVNKGKMEIFEA